MMRRGQSVPVEAVNIITARVSLVAGDYRSWPCKAGLTRCVKALYFAASLKQAGHVLVWLVPNGADNQGLLKVIRDSL